jgi:hypothetical protein
MAGSLPRGILGEIVAGTSSVTNAMLGAGVVTDAKVAANAAIAGSKLANGAIANAQVAANAAIVGSKLAAKARRHSAVSDLVSLTNAGPATVSKVLMMPSTAITITKARLIYETASDGGTVPNVEVGIDGALTSVVAAVAAEANKAAYYYKDLTIASGAVAANKAVIFSTVADGAKTSTGAVRLEIEYTVDD